VSTHNHRCKVPNPANGTHPPSLQQASGSSKRAVGCAGISRRYQLPVSAACISCLHQLPASAACISCLHQLPASAATCRLPASAACINQPAAEHVRRRRLRGPTVGTRNLYPSLKSPSVSCPVAIGCGGRSDKRFLGSRHQRCTLSHALSLRVSRVALLFWRPVLLGVDADVGLQ
jgi:hypothetical protein